jgi:O-acetyl-ADP-ribose deacetylase
MDRSDTRIVGTIGVQIEIVRGNIVDQAVDAIINAANTRLLGGGGVDGAIHDAAGPSLLDECLALRESDLVDGLPVGQAVATKAGMLPADWVIHTVGPMYSANEDRAHLLASCYRESLRVADQIGAKTVAFPAISAGEYGWPADDTASIALNAVATTDTEVELVRFVMDTSDLLVWFLIAAATG